MLSFYLNGDYRCEDIICCWCWLCVIDKALLIASKFLVTFVEVTAAAIAVVLLGTAALLNVSINFSCLVKGN